jgi:RNA polymerase sigma-70 factor (ECF subfamily)
MNSASIYDIDHDRERCTGREPNFHDLLLATLPVLRQQAMALTRHRADAEDLVQTSISNALAAQDSFTVGTNFRAWMVCILRNRFISNVRRRRETVDLDDAHESQLGRSGGQEESIAFRELRRHLLRLPVNQRQILLMISIQGLSYEEASEQLGVAIGTLKCRVFRARTLLTLWGLGETANVSAADAPAASRSRDTASSMTRSRPRDVAFAGEMCLT